MAECYRSSIDRSHDHKGPLFYLCRKCGKTMCYNCIGKNLASGGKLCVECAAPKIAPRYQRFGRVRPDGIQKETFRHLVNLIKITLLKTSNIIALVFVKTASVLLIFLSSITLPFRNRKYEQNSRPSLSLSFESYKDKVQFTRFLIGIMVLIAIGAFIYAEFVGISIYLVLVTIIASGICWGMTSVYLLYLFHTPLGRPVSQILAYFLAFFVALLLEIWLLNQQWLVKLIG